jgi:hypothetical protein
MAEHTGRINADEYFAILPEWVLYADISSYSVRLYCVLRRHADQRGICFPSRRRLAELGQMSESTLDRSLKELVAIGALIIERRATDMGDYTSNRYTVVSQRGGGVCENPPPPKSEATGGVRNEALTKAIVNESQELELMLTETVSEPVESDFDRFWAQYPRKVGKQKAQKAWGRLTKKEKIAIFGVLGAHVSQWRGVRPEFVPHATSWLNGRRWEDELDVVSPVVRSRSAPGMGVLRHIMSYNNEQGELG